MNEGGREPWIFLHDKTSRVGKNEIAHNGLRTRLHSKCSHMTSVFKSKCFTICWTKTSYGVNSKYRAWNITEGTRQQNFSVKFSLINGLYQEASEVRAFTWPYSPFLRFSFNITAEVNYFIFSFFWLSLNSANLLFIIKYWFDDLIIYWITFNREKLVTSTVLC